MTIIDAPPGKLLALRFDELPIEHRARAYGVDYARFVFRTGGELLITRYGWSFASLVLPKAWFADQRYSHEGRRLPGSTGTVYRVPVTPPIGSTDSLVVKFSRMAQDVPIFVDKPIADLIPRSAVDNACFNDPFEEFGLLMELRQSLYGPTDLRILTKRPLAIYSPAVRYELWQLGRKEWVFDQHSFRLSADQEKNAVGTSVSLDLHRDYIVVFQWVKGLDAETWHVQGSLSEADMHSLHFRVMQELQQKGFMVLDHKPRHVILRGPNGRHGLLSRRGALCYALVDFELLKRTSDYEASLSASTGKCRPDAAG